MDFQEIDRYLALVAAAEAGPPRQVAAGETLRVGLDLGTCLTVLTVLSMDGEPLVCCMERSNALKDGVVVDYFAACQTVRRLKEHAEQKLGVELMECAIAMPPGTEETDGRTHCYVASSSGLEVTALVDEPSAANRLLRLENGAVVDIGGGTTGISVLHNGQVVHVGDEPTGGTHLSLVLAGNRQISFEEAERYKLDAAHHGDVLAVTAPVIEKMAQIVLDEIRGYDVRELCLVGGTCCLTGMENIFRKYTGLAVFKPENPLLVTPVGIALCHREEKGR